MDDKQFIKELVDKSRKAQKIYETFNQQQVDRVVRALAKVVWDNAEPLAKMAAEETGMGVYEDKIAKNRGKSRIIWNSLKGKKSVGIIDEDKEKGLFYVAKPMGVIGMVTPCTNPIVTPMCNLMLPPREELGFHRPNRGAKEMQQAHQRSNEQGDAKLGAPENLIQFIDEPTIERLGELSGR
jgi:succinate-semialdehyde dehydrogenase